MKLILEAQLIPDGCIVHKATGTKPYMLRKHGIKLFTEAGMEVIHPNSFILQSEEHICLISPTLELAVFFDNIIDTHRFTARVHDEQI